jgi:hypothetical protein
MKIRQIISILLISIVVLLITGGCNGKDTTPATSTPNALSAAWCKATVDNFRSIETGKLPDYLTQGDSSKQGGEFDVNKYFTVLTHLSMEPGYVLDWVYDFNGSGGNPVLYVRPEKEAPFKTYQEFGAAAELAAEPANDYSLIWMVKGENAAVDGNRIKIDGTNEGYFEYTVLQILGGQFYLWWHANYNDTRILCDAADIDDILLMIDNSGYMKINEDFKKDARNINAQPVLEISGGNVTVKLLTFSMWGGFSRSQYTISRNYPHAVTGLSEETLLEYYVGITF